MRNLLKIALVANIFEWYEFTIYAYLANIIGQFSLMQAHLSVELSKFFRSSQLVSCSPIRQYFLRHYGRPHWSRLAAQDVAYDDGRPNHFNWVSSNLS